MRGTILYYPTINIYDSEWLRSSILYWDNVSSIVPGDQYSEENSPEIEWLLQQGLYRPIYPHDISEIYQNKLHDSIEKMIYNHKKDKNPPNGFRIHNDKMRNVTQQASLLNDFPYTRTRRRDERNYRIHRDKINSRKAFDLHANKIPNDLINALCEAGIAHEDSKGQWLNMNESFAIRLMSVLARYLAASHEGMFLGTDDVRVFNQINPIFNKCGKQDIDAYVDTELRNALPTPRMDASYEEIVDFKNKRRTELNKFRRFINSYERDVKNCTKTSEIDEIIHYLRADLLVASDEISELMRERRIYGRKASFKTMAHIGVAALIDVGAAVGILPPLTSIASHAGVEIVSKVIDGAYKTNDVSPEFEYLYYAHKEGLVR